MTYWQNLPWAHKEAASLRYKQQQAAELTAFLNQQSANRICK